MHSIIVSVWLMFNTKMIISLAISWRGQVTCDEMMMMLDAYSATLKQQSSGRHVDPLRHIILISRQTVFSLIR